MEGLLADRTGRCATGAANGCGLAGARQFCVRARPPRQGATALDRPTILECESLVLAGPVPACVVRLGYLYGPESLDLLAYRKAFRIGRPYWAGPQNALQHQLHLHDAVSALVKAGRARNAGEVFYATDGAPVAFRQFMDDFARKVGNPFPLHVPRIATALIKLVVRKEHMQQVALAMPSQAPLPRVPGWKPRYADYREGLDQTLAAWSG
jgi:nucleoside-diphosphate-sugar epimerase